MVFMSLALKPIYLAVLHLPNVRLRHCQEKPRFCEPEKQLQDKVTKYEVRLKELLNNQNIIITAPSLDPTQNVSGVSTVVQFIIENNKEREYQHFQIGKTDKESGGVLQRLLRIWKCYGEWRLTLTGTGTITKIATKTKHHSVTTKTIIHYSFPLSAPSILRDPWFMHYALKRGYKMVVHVHGGLFLTAPKIPFLLERILKWVFSWDVPFIVLSEGEKEILQTRFGAKRVEVLPNCPSVPLLTPSIESSREHELSSRRLLRKPVQGGFKEDETLRYEDFDNDNLDNQDNFELARSAIEPASATSDLNSEASAEVLNQREARFEPAKRLNHLNQRSDLNLEPTCEASALNQRRALILGYLGRIEPNKGMTELLAALNKLKAEGIKFKVRFAGKEQTEGEYLPKFEEALGENFEYCGLVSGETKREFLNSLDVFVMPTYFEGLPMSLLETMSYGAVPVVTEVGSIPTVVKDGENGLFVKVKDVESICEALKKLDEDRALLTKMSDEARRTIQENFSAAKYVERLNAIYDSL